MIPRGGIMFKINKLHNNVVYNVKINYIILFI